MLNHNEWINREKDIEAIKNRAGEEETPWCENCFCLGNKECGHDCLDEDCTLLPEMICKCCKKTKEAVNE